MDATKPHTTVALAHDIHCSGEVIVVSQATEVLISILEGRYNLAVVKFQQQVTSAPAW